ncbi:MAG TPA: Uma2 family endonuclease [Xanthobacteraceae bacterium]|jgi:Uma2 family endonuclease
MTALLKPKMTVDEFLRWAEQQPEQRWELIDGEAVLMSPERAGHGETTLSVSMALLAGITAARLPCRVLPDSVVVRIDRHTTFQPDVMVYCGERVPPDTLEINTPVIVVEVLSPSTAARDFRDKLVGYFRVPSIQHYLIVDPDRRSVIHHKRGVGEVIETRIVSAGALRLDPPGLEIQAAELFAPQA